MRLLESPTDFPPQCIFSVTRTSGFYVNTLLFSLQELTNCSDKTTQPCNYETILFIIWLYWGSV